MSPVWLQKLVARARVTTPPLESRAVPSTPTPDPFIAQVSETAAFPAAPTTTEPPRPPTVPVVSANPVAKALPAVGVRVPLPEVRSGTTPSPPAPLSARPTPPLPGRPDVRHVPQAHTEPAPIRPAALTACEAMPASPPPPDLSALVRRMVQDALPKPAAPVEEQRMVALVQKDATSVDARAPQQRVREIVRVETVPVWRAEAEVPVPVSPRPPSQVRGGLDIGHLHVEIVRDAEPRPVPIGRPARRGPEPVRVTDHMLAGRS